MRFALSSAPLDPAALARDTHRSAAGALVTFEGWIRDHNEGRGVTALEYEAYGPLAQAEGERIALAAEERFDVEAVRCVHRVGRLVVGEIAVWVGASAAHREAAFGACSYVIDEVKARVPIWKKEHYADGSSKWTAPGRPAPAARGT
jgi:molybdopterin synthase catalytic subunit